MRRWRGRRLDRKRRARGAARRAFRMLTRHRQGCRAGCPFGLPFCFLLVGAEAVSMGADHGLGATAARTRGSRGHLVWARARSVWSRSGIATAAQQGCEDSWQGGQGGPRDVSRTLARGVWEEQRGLPRDEERRGGQAEAGRSRRNQDTCESLENGARWKETRSRGRVRMVSDLARFAPRGFDRW